MPRRSPSLLFASAVVAAITTLLPTSGASAATVVGGPVDCRTGAGAASVTARPGESFTLEFTGTVTQCGDAALTWDTGLFSSVSIPRRVKIDPAAGSGAPYRVTFTLASTAPIGTTTLIELWDGVVYGPPIPVTVVDGPPPPPWWQSKGRVAGAACEDGWGPSWAAWAVPVTGGWVCDRVVHWRDGRWVQSADLGGSQPHVDWDGRG